MSDQFLKCDAAECDHREDVERITQEMVNKPCPKCGANLLTQDDFDQFSELSAMMADFRRMADELPPPQPGEAAVRVAVHLEDGELRVRFTPVTA